MLVPVWIAVLIRFYQRGSWTRKQKIQDKLRFFFKETTKRFRQMITIRNEKEAERFDDNLEKIEKKYQSSQEEFYIHSNSFIEN